MNELVISLPDLVRRWQMGWGLAKGLAPAEEAPGGLRVLLGQPDRHQEIIALSADDDPDSLRGLAAEVAGAAQPNWLTVPTNQPEKAEATLRAAGLELLDRPEWFMSTYLADHPTRKPPEHYTATTAVSGAVIEVTVTHASGEVAASGTMAVTGTDAVAHNIITAPEHRRRGLASVVMGSLVERARTAGAKTGLLIASADGQHLYSTLGWTPQANILIARTPR